MLSAQEIANYLVEKLDAIGATRPEAYEFSILAEVAKGYDGKKINGMVKTVSPELSPFPAGYVEANYVFVVEMFVSGPTNRRYLNINDIINEFITQNQAATITFANGKGVMTFTMGVPKGYQIAYELGEGVPLTFTVHVTYTENGVTSGDKHWLLDGVEIPFLSESVSVEREGISRKIYTDVYSKILLTGQTKFYTFRIPYESTTFKSLQAEILQAPAVNSAVHTLTYYDGAAFTQDKPYTAKVSIYRSASANSTRPNAAAYDVTFSDVYDSDGKALKYYIALIDFPFDMQGDDTRYFNSTAEQIAYFKEKAVASSAPFIEIEAPNLDGLVITKQVYRAPAASALSQFDYVSKNYAVIKVVFADTAQYFYYFIENATIGADGCVMVDLKMDTVQTFFFNPEITFSDCLIERAHLNRFVPVEGDPTKVKFVTDPASKIYNSEAGFNFPKRLVDRQKLKLFHTTVKEVDEWLDKYVAYWVYVFIDPTHEYTVGDLENLNNTKTISELAMEYGKITNGTYYVQFEPSIHFPDLSNIKSAVACYCYPIYKDFYNTNKKGIADTPSTAHNGIILRTYKDETASSYIDIIPSELGRKNFEKANDSSSYYYSIKLSIVSPFTGYAFINSDTTYNYTIDERNNLIIECVKSTAYDELALVNRKGVSNLSPTIIRTFAKFSNSAGSTPTTLYKNSGLFFGMIGKINPYIITSPYYLPENYTILKSNIVSQQSPNLAYNPKLNSQNFKELTITTASGDSFSYDIQKLNGNSAIFLYTEPITPEVTKYYMRAASEGLYEEGTAINYMGLVGSTDNSLAYTNEQYAAYIANNKNFYLQSNMKLVASAAKSTIGIAGQAATGDYDSAVVSGLTAGIDLATSAIDRSLTVDNMKNAPDQLKNANGNVIFNLSVTDLGLYVEKYSALEGDLKTANDFMNLYGFTFSSIANVRDYVHIRKYHNYIKAQLQSINGNISNIIRADLRQRFAEGIRFWNNDVVSYAYENYELWLET